MNAPSAPQPPLRPSRCPVCGRSAREFAPCPWCGERAPAARETRTDAALLLLAWAAMALPPQGAAGCFAAGVLLTFRVRAVRLRAPSERVARGALAAASHLVEPVSGLGAPMRGAAGGAGRTGGRLRRMAGRLLDVRSGLAVALPALAAAVVALAAGRFPVSAASLRPAAAAVPALLAAAACLGRAPAEAPVPEGGARARMLARDLPGLFLLLLVLPPALFPSVAAAPAAALGVLLARLDRPLPWLFFAASALAASVPDASAFALGAVLGTALAPRAARCGLELPVPVG